MLTPTTTFGMRLVGAGAHRAALSTAFAKPSLQTPCSCYTPAVSRPFSSSRPLSILSHSIARDAFRSTSISSPLLSRIIRRAQSTAAAPEPSTSPNQRLDWNTFFALRKARRRWQLAFSVVMLGVSGTAGAAVLAAGVAEPIVSQIPLDPFLTLGFMVMGFAALGWLMGPSIGSAVFNTLNRQWKKQITLKETEFFARIKKNRVDPSASGASNPVPDFYGENISSVAGYRQWLKDQRAFNKKRTRFV